jgi:hypothetical protein
MKSNLTLKLDTALLREAKVLAAEEGTSISAIVAEKLEQAVRERKGYAQARKRAIEQMRNARDLGWIKPKSRDELHER